MCLGMANGYRVPEKENVNEGTKMSDQEIIRALECIASEENVLCDSCPNKKFYLLECHRQGAKNALDLINRQQAELDNYSHNIKNLTESNMQLHKEIEDVRIAVKSYKGKYESAVETARELKLVIAEKQAEIERLTEENLILSSNADTAFQDGLNEAQELYAEQIRNEIKTEAIKDFAERLKNEIINDTAYGCDSSQHSGYYDYKIKIGDITEYIDNLVKEMG